MVTRNLISWKPEYKIFAGIHKISKVRYQGFSGSASQRALGIRKK